MLNPFRSHPFPVQATLEKSIVLSFALPKESLSSFIPSRLELDTFDDKWAFLTIAMVSTTGLRPKGFPPLFGRNFFLVGYRIFVKYYTLKGRRLRGLYILRSETNKRSMQLLGNIFTHYNYETIDIQFDHQKENNRISSKKSQFQLEYSSLNEDLQLPNNSPFRSWKEARRFAGPLPFTFSYQEAKKEMIIVEGVRQNWKPQPINIQNYYFNFLENMDLPNAILANAFEITNIPYYWKKAKIEKW